MYLKQYIQHVLIWSTMLPLFVACQSAPPPQKKIQHTNTTTTQITRQTIPVIRSQDGVQDIRWTLSQIKSKKALFFTQAPTLHLQSNHQRFIGNTGCNTLYGSYDIDVAKQTIQFKASAGHQRCDNALAQEADLMDALDRIRYFQVQGKTIRLMDSSRQVLIQAEQR